MYLLKGGDKCLVGLRVLLLQKESSWRMGGFERLNDVYFWDDGPFLEKLR